MTPADLCSLVQRRRLLLASGTIVATGLAGCVGGQPRSPGGTPSDTPTEPSYSFTVTATRCGNQENRADVTVAEGTVIVEGTTWGNDACYTGRLDSVTLEADTLTVRVVAESTADDDRACAQCITEIDYRAHVEVAERPDRVVVIHDGETVATVTP